MEDVESCCASRCKKQPSEPAHALSKVLLIDLPSCPAFFCRVTDRLAFAPSEPLTTPARLLHSCTIVWRLYLSTSLAPFFPRGPLSRCPLPFTFCYRRGQSIHSTKIAANILSQAQCSRFGRIANPTAPERPLPLPLCPPLPIAHCAGAPVKNRHHCACPLSAACCPPSSLARSLCWQQW